MTLEHEISTEIDALRALLLEAHKALAYADLVKNDEKVTRDFLSLDKEMAALNFFPHRMKK